MIKDTRLYRLMTSPNKAKQIIDHLQWHLRRIIGKNLSKDKPVIFMSACKDENITGDFIFNGGVKLFNLWSKQLRSHGFLAYIVTYDGKFEPWMLEHQTHISLETAAKWKKAGKHIRFFTPWLDSTAYLKLAKRFYFHDCEPAYSFGIHLFLLIKFLLLRQIIKLSTETRAEQAYYRAKLGLDTCLVPPYPDPAFICLDSKNRLTNRIGFVGESDSTLQQIKYINRFLKKNNIKAEFVSPKGKEFVHLVKTCDLYLGLNPGKDKFHTEGLARTHLEAMSAGAVVVAFDVGGNREFLFDTVNGRLIPQGKLKELAQAVKEILSHSQEKERLRASGVFTATQIFTQDRAWPDLKRFLDLDSYSDVPTSATKEKILNLQELNLLLRGPSYLAEEELPTLKKYSAQALKTIVEIGCAYGASSLLFLAYSQPKAEIYSIDAFTSDPETKPPMGAPKFPTADICQNNVKSALDILNLSGKLSKWQLISDYSHHTASKWKRGIDLLFIDGDHSYSGVKQDFEDWFPFVKKDGFILLHDSRRIDGKPTNEFHRGWQGPTRLAAELKHRKDLKLIAEVYCLTVWKRLN